MNSRETKGAIEENIGRPQGKNQEPAQVIPGSEGLKHAGFSREELMEIL